MHKCDHCGGMHMSHRCGMRCKHCGSAHHGTRSHWKHHPKRRANVGYYGIAGTRRRKSSKGGILHQRGIRLPRL